VDNRGLVPDADVRRLEEFGSKIAGDFTAPVGLASGKGTEFEIKFRTSQKLSSVIIMEDIVKGERIREYELSGMQDGIWNLISKGASVGHKRIENTYGTFEAIKLTITKSEGTPFIRKIACYGSENRLNNIKH